MSGNTQYAPTQAGFNAWVVSAMGISTDILSSDSIYLVYAFNVAVEIVNEWINCVSPLIFMLATYNLAGDNLINWCQDNPSLTPPNNVFFANLRTKYGCGNFQAGVVTSTSDEGTSTGLTTPEAFKEFTLSNLQNLKTPYGRQYLAFAQDFGVGWGIS